MVNRVVLKGTAMEAHFLKDFLITFEDDIDFKFSRQSQSSKKTRLQNPLLNTNHILSCYGK